MAGERPAKQATTRKPRVATDATPPAGTVRLTGLAPLVSPDTRVLVLGSFPGAASLASGQYYGHPQNHFWKILAALWPEGAPVMSGPAIDSYERRVSWMLDHGIGLWDVYASCERQGSLDSAIRHPVVNDFAALVRQCPKIAAVVHNGAESFRHAAAGAVPGLPVYRLPSTSPANASWSFGRKLAAWREVFDKHGWTDG
ncbi:MAG: DNA-deoxyinosine glycosylase [Polaromonas sp.]|nr:DNA-deoxyinosine glycosylase [Polaromonas sp.]